MPARHFTITGHVQGVFFRATTRMQAEALNIKGWVRNNADGSVEMIGEGTNEALDMLEAWCHHGPPAARVEQVLTKEVPEEGLKTFISERG